jgi:hypothetical protein
MSSDQFSEKPLPQGKKRCPYCGEILKASDAACWLCLENVGVQEGWPEPSPSDRANLHRTHASSGESAALAIFGILAVLWIIGTAFEAPGMLLILLVLAVPALIRAAMSAQRGADDIERTPNFFLLFLNSLGVAALVGVASAIAFWATCVVICFGGLGLGALSNHGSGTGLLYISVGGGIIIGVIVAGWLLYATRPRKR